MTENTDDLLKRLEAMTEKYFIDFLKALRPEYGKSYDAWTTIITLYAAALRFYELHHRITSLEVGYRDQSGRLAFVEGQSSGLKQRVNLLEERVMAIEDGRNRVSSMFANDLNGLRKTQRVLDERLAAVEGLVRTLSDAGKSQSWPIPTQTKYPANRSQGTDHQLWATLNQVFVTATGGKIDPHVYNGSGWEHGSTKGDFEELFGQDNSDKTSCYLSAISHFQHHIFKHATDIYGHHNVLKWREAPEILQQPNGKWSYYMRLAIARCEKD